MLKYWHRWMHFWTAPADPTPLGVMRILTGILCLYVHAVYTFDLNEFFGKNAWYGLNEINKERTQFPWIVLGPLTGKTNSDDFVRSAHVPMYPHRRDAVMEFLRQLPAEKQERKAALAYVVRLQETRQYQQVLDGFAYLDRLGSAGEARKARLDALVDEKLRTPVDFVPDCLRVLPAEGSNSRVAARAEIERLLKNLPGDFYQRKYVTDHMGEMDFVTRRLFLEFIDNLPENAEARKAEIDYLEYWHTERSKTYRQGHPIFSIWYHVTDPNGMKVAHGVVMGIFVLYTVGLFTRIVSILAWLAAVSYIHRTQHILFGMDTMMNLCLLYCMLGPSGAALSLDRLWNRYRAAKASLDRCGHLDDAAKQYLAAPPPDRIAGLALRMVQVQYCFIYGASGLSKLKGNAWWTTTAFWDTLANPEFSLVQYQWYESALRWMMSDRLSYQLMSAAGVYGTLFLEIGFPFLAWTRLRPRIVILSALFHTAIAVFMGLVVFALFMLVLLVAFTPGIAYRRILTPQTGPKRVLRFRNSDAKDRHAAAWAVAFDFDRSLELEAGPGRLVRHAGATPRYSTEVRVNRRPSRWSSSTRKSPSRSSGQASKSTRLWATVSWSACTSVP
jgi:hypothetical protein